jgi:type IV pilus modification protein PilV
VSLRRGERGFTLIEILIALVILAFGLLSLARVQARASLTEVEARQRTQAMTLVQDMVDRINLNRKNAAAYVGEHAAYAVASCTGLPTQVARDLCEWRDLLSGAETMDGTRLTGAPIAAQGCIITPSPTSMSSPLPGRASSRRKLPRVLAAAAISPARPHAGCSPPSCRSRLLARDQCGAHLTSRPDSRW